MNEETGSEGLSDLLRVTELKVRSGSRVTVVHRLPGTRNCTGSLFALLPLNPVRMQNLLKLSSRYATG